MKSGEGHDNTPTSSTLYMHCSCHELSHTIRANYWYDDPETYYIETITPTTNIFRRAWQAFKWVLGFEVVFGETVVGKKEAIQLRDHLDQFLKNETLLSEKSRPIYEWLLKYDPHFKDNPEAALKFLIEEGAEAAYAKSLAEIHDPFDVDPENGGIW